MVLMGLKKKGKKKNKDIIDSRPKGSSRAILALRIAESDSTFVKCYVDDATYVYVGKCIHCGTALRVSSAGSTDATIEHIVPLIAGGSGTDLLNVALACARCNNQKGIHHDQKKLSERSQEIIDALLEKRKRRLVKSFLS